MVKTHSFRSSMIKDLVPTSSVNDEDLLFPSPPRAPDALSLHQETLEKVQTQENAALQSVGLKRKSSLLDRLNHVGSLMGDAFAGDSPSDLSSEKQLLAPPSSPSPSSPSPTVRSKKASWSSYRESARINMPTLLEILDEGPPSLPPPKPKPAQSSTPAPRPGSQLFSAGRTFSARGGGMIPPTSPHSTYNTKHVSTQQKTPVRSTNPQPTPIRHTMLGASLPRFSFQSERSSDGPSIITSTSGSKKSGASSNPSRNIGRTALFHPSELEDIMAPLKRQHVEAQTDELKQAKAAYDQLNTQLTDELPQLIDLR